jgi:cellulose synthase/poly-beta-1,6-N-acetylglucosamine synthase-like glycosyltransferase
MTKALVIHPLVRILLVPATLLALESLWSFLDGRRFVRLVRRSLGQPPGSYQPPAAVIVPCKGLDPGFDLNLTAFLTQRYPAYQLIFVVASEEDPAYRYLKERLKAPAARGPALKTALLVAGRSEARGEKVNNLLAGIAAVEPQTEVLVFADADATPREDWLKSLVAPLEDGRVTVSTGFRWYLPGESFASQLRAAWDASIATMMGEHDHNFAWGGSMAIRAADFKRLRVAERYWASTVSDDYALSARPAAGFASSLGASSRAARIRASANFCAGPTARSLSRACTRHASGGRRSGSTCSTARRFLSGWAPSFFLLG